MKILYLLSSTQWTGPAEPVAAVARGMAGLGHEVAFAGETKRPGNIFRRMEAAGILVLNFGEMSVKSGPVAVIKDISALRKTSAAFDIVHANFSHDHLLAYMALRKTDPPRLVRTVHAAKSLKAAPGRKTIYKNTDGIATVCDGYRETLISRFGLDPERVATIRGAVDTGTFSPGDCSPFRNSLGLDEDAPLAGIVSRIKPERGHMELAEAFAEAAGAVPEARLAIIGRGERFVMDLALRIDELGMGRTILFSGYRKGPDLVEAYRGLDVKVMLAEGNDGTCRAAMEAMACGTPVIASRTGALAELVDDRCGWLVEPGDKAGLAKAMIEALSNRVATRRKGESARRKILASYNESIRTGAFAGFYDRIYRMNGVR